MNLSAEQKDAILTLINEKINNDMEKVLTKIDSTINKIETIKAEFNNQFSNQNAKFDSQNAKFDSQFNMLKWLVGGIGFTLIAATIVALIKYIFFSKP